MNKYGWLSLCVLILSIFLMLGMDNPGYSDAYYYYNAAARVADGDGLTDNYLWIYINAPDEIPSASHRYWMPLTSIITAVPMVVLGSNFTAAQLILVPFLIGLSCSGMWLGGRLGQTRRHAWIAGLSVPLGGFFLPFWLTTDTFVIFGLIGAGALIMLGFGRETGDWNWYAAAGLLGGLAHLTRADGVLLILVGLLVIWIPTLRKRQFTGLRIDLTNTVVLISTYLITMSAWFLRNINVMGSPLPSGGIDTIFLREYNDLFSYPAKWSLDGFLDWGMGNILQSRLDGLMGAFGTWIAVEGFVVLTPFAAWALWQRRREGFWAGVIWYAIGLHLAMSVVFTFPGIRGGLFHSSAALLPFWVALGLVGIDDAVRVVSRWRKWRVKEAQMVFGTAIIFLPMALGFNAWSAQQELRNNQPDYQPYADELPADARIMVNDPMAWYYYTGLRGVALPDASLELAYEIAQKYHVTHLIIDENVTDSFLPLIKGEAEPPEFLTEISHFTGSNPDDWSDDVRIYAFSP